MTAWPTPTNLSSPPCGWACVFCFPEQIADPCEECNIKVPHKKHAIAKDVGRVAHEVLKDMYEHGDGFNEFVQHNHNCAIAYVKCRGIAEEKVPTYYDQYFLGSVNHPPLFAPGSGYCFSLRGRKDPASCSVSVRPNRDILAHTVQLNSYISKERLKKEADNLYENSTEKTFIDPLTSQERITRFGERQKKIAHRNCWLKVASGGIAISLGCIIGIILIILI